MKYLYAIIVSIALLSTACQSKPKAVLAEEGPSFFGEKIDQDGAIALSEIPAALPEGDTLDVKVVAQIDNVCQKKGCWMNIKADDTDQQVFVRFKDYGFFMPTNSAGNDVVVRGKLYSNVTSVDELRHYAEDEGKSEEEIAQITEPKVELRMMADGVIIP